MQDQHRLPRKWSCQHRLTQHTDPSARTGSGGSAHTLAWKAVVPDSGIIAQSGPMMIELSRSSNFFWSKV